MALATVTAWLRSLLNWPMKLRSGHRTREKLRSAIARSWMSLTVYGVMPLNETHWISDDVKLQCFYRENTVPVYVGAVGDGRSEAFYALGDMAQWFMEMGVDMQDPIWEFIDQLATEELTDAAEPDDA